MRKNNQAQSAPAVSPRLIAFADMRKAGEPIYGDFTRKLISVAQATTNILSGVIPFQKRHSPHKGWHHQ